MQAVSVRAQAGVILVCGETQMQRRVPFPPLSRAWLAFPLVAAVVLGSGTLAIAQSSVDTIFGATLAEPNQKTAEISTQELQRILTEGTATVFDARPPMEYAISHVPGALNVAQKPGTSISVYISDVAEIERQVPDKNHPLVLYCNGPYCGKSKRLSDVLLAAGYTNVRRYQLGAPTWRALVGTMQIELAGLKYVWESDHTAVFLDARSPEEFQAGTVPGARNLQVDDVERAKEDGRLPMEDHNTRVIVFGGDADQARAVADRVAKNAFHNVAFFGGDMASLETIVDSSAGSRAVTIQCSTIRT
jgi:rhodanese-related sulfurtransferase